MRVLREFKVLCLCFTFQSGYIPIKPESWSYLLEEPLHSNLVIFQSGKENLLLLDFLLYIPIWLYSNTLPNKLRHNETVFTFQSGYIPIGLNNHLEYLVLQLYIPIWLYSNCMYS